MKADNGYVKELLTNLHQEVGMLTAEAEQSFKSHVVQRILQKTFGKQVSSFHNILSVFWELSSREMGSKKTPPPLICFLEALTQSLGEICMLTSVPEHISDDDIGKRLNMLVYEYAYNYQ